MNMKSASTVTTYGPGIAAALATLALAAHASEPFELKTHRMDVSGARDIESGNYERGVRRLETGLGTRDRPASLRTPVLIDLCAGYTMLSRIEEATNACDEATSTAWYSGLSYNNRGVLNVVKGNYEAAIKDFEMAVVAGGADDVAKANLDRARQRLVEIRWQRDQVYAAGNVDVYDVNIVTVTSAEGDGR